MQVPFGEWLPDLPDHVNPGSTQAKNVYPAVNSYRPWRAIVNASGNGLDAKEQVHLNLIVVLYLYLQVMLLSYIN